jgi:hypothetical protein
VIFSRLGRFLPWVLLLVFAGRGLLAMRADGTTVDEPLHLWYGQRALTSGTFLRGDAALNSKMPVSVLNAIPVVAATRVRPLSWPRQLFLARLPTLLLGALLGGLVWRWAQALFGAWSGTLALLLYTFCPNVLAHSHLVTTDISTALAIFAATWCLWRYLAAPSPGRLLLAAAVFGAAQLTKATALFLLPIFALILLERALRRAIQEAKAQPSAWRSGARAFMRQAARGGALLVLCGLGAIVALNLGFLCEGSLTPLKRYTLASPGLKSLAAIPLLRDVPLPLPYAYVQGLDMVGADAMAEAWTYLRGQYSRTGFRSYFFWAFLVKVPVATQLLLLFALGLWWSGRARAPGAEGFLLVPVLVLFVYFSFFFRLDIGFRYILPVLPFLFVFISRVAAPGSCQSEALPFWKPALAAILLIWLALSSFSIHPRYLAYFNELAGGPANGWRWLIDANLDWGQDDERVHDLFGKGDRITLFGAPSGPVAGRIAVGIFDLVGHDPGAFARHAWLRDNFEPIATIGYSWKVFDVTEAGIARCCAELPRAWVLDDLADDLALRGQPVAGGDGVIVRFQEKLNDGMLGANDWIDAARTTPPRPRPVRAWFGITWRTPQTVGRVLAFPTFYSRGAMVRRFLARDYVLQSWGGSAWRDIPGTRVEDNQALHLEHRFPPVRTTGIRLLIENERNDQGTLAPAGGYRAVCLELAAYAR